MDVLLMAICVTAAVLWLAGAKDGRRRLLACGAVSFLFLAALLLWIDETTIRVNQLGFVLLGVGLTGLAVMWIGRGRQAGDKWVIRAKLAIILVGLLFVIAS